MLFIVILASQLSVSIGNVSNVEKYETLVTPRSFPHHGDQFNSKYEFTGFNYVMFQAKACQQATLYIGKYRGKGFNKGLVPDIIVQFGPRDTHLIVMGKKQAYVMFLTRAGMLNCTEFKEFYVKWGGHNGHVEMGSPKEVLMTLIDPEYATRPIGPGVGPRGPATTWRIFNPFDRQTDCCSRSQTANRYCVSPNSNCKLFTQRAWNVTNLHRCVAGTRFDTRGCVCNHIELTPCKV